MAHRVLSGPTEWCSKVLTPRGVRLLSTLLLAGLLFVPQASSARAFEQQSADERSGRQGQNNVQQLESGRPIEREFAYGEVHTYEFLLGAGQFLHAVVDQRGIDVVVVVFSPAGKQVLEEDSPNGRQGPEPVYLVAEEEGTYRLEVRSSEKGAPAGRYEIRIEEKREARPEDRPRIACERALAEAERLRLEGTASAKIKAIEKYEEALPCLQAEATREREARTLNTIGLIYNSLGEMQKALDYYKRALLGRRTMGDRAGERTTLSNIGLVFLSLGEKQQALDHLNQALAIAREIGDRAGEGVTLNNLGLIYNSLGEKQKALDHYNEALAIKRAVGDRRGEATVLNNIAMVYSSLGEDQKALKYLNQALPITKALGDREKEALTLNNIGTSLSFLGDHQKALESLEQALSIWKALGDRVGESTTLDNIGLVYYYQGDKEKALELYNQALTMRRTTGVRLGETAMLNNIGTVYESRGENQKALEAYSQALPLVAIGDLVVEANTLFNMARAERALGYLPQSRSHAEAAIDILESVRARVAGPQFRSSFSALVHVYYEFYTDLLMQQDKLDSAAGHNRAAFEVAERKRARTLVEGLIENHADIRQGVSRSLLERDRALTLLLNGKIERRIRLLSDRHTPEQAAEVTKEVDALISEYQELQSEIRARSPQYAALTQPQPLSLADVQQQVLDADTMLLEYSLGKDRSYLWVVTQSSLTSFELPKRQEIETAARRVYDLLTERSQNKFGVGEERRRRIAIADAESLKALADLSRMVLGPAGGTLAKRRLLIVSDGALQYVPFAALPTPSRVAKSRSKERPLILDHEVICLPSASTLAVLRREFQARKPAPRLLAVLADPVFEKDDPRITANSGQAEQAVRSASTSERPGKASARENGPADSELVRSFTGTSIADGTGRIRRLPFTRQEAKSIASLVAREDELEALDFDANLAAAMSPELGRYRYVHFATHAILNSEHPELSGVVLSLVDKNGDEQSGFLKAYEVYNLKLNAELVVLSSCRTALGKEVKGEGLVGLTRGFMYAGAARVLASLWNVGDEATAQLMANFYQDLLGSRHASPAAAIRAAQIKMLKVKKWQSPYYWAGFTLQGEPR